MNVDVNHQESTSCCTSGCIPQPSKMRQLSAAKKNKTAPAAKMLHFLMLFAPLNKTMMQPFAWQDAQRLGIKTQRNISSLPRNGNSACPKQEQLAPAQSSCVQTSRRAAFRRPKRIVNTSDRNSLGLQCRHSKNSGKHVCLKTNKNNKSLQCIFNLQSSL